MSYPTPADYRNYSVDRGDIIHALNEFAVASNTGIVIFCIEVGLFWLAVGGALFLPWMLARIGCSIFAGLRYANFIILAHDAAHGNLARDPRVSKWMALYALTHCGFNYRIWIFDHHRSHHPHPNAMENEAWRPLSLDEWRSARPFRRFRERIYRSPTLVNFGIYLLAVRRQVIAHYFHEASANDKAAAIRCFLGQGTFMLVYWAALLAAPWYSERGSLEAWLLGFAVPFFIFNTFFGLATYLQHVHPHLPFFLAPTLVARYNRQEFQAATQVFPNWLSTIMHHVQYHVVHHVHPRIPVWRLRRAYQTLYRMAGPVLITDKGSFGHIMDIMRRCKLYDYESHRWLDFRGRPTSEPIALAVVNATSLGSGETPAGADACIPRSTA